MLENFYLCRNLTLSLYEEVSFQSDYSTMVDMDNRGEVAAKQLSVATVQKADDAVGISGIPRESRRWYVAIVNNKSEKACLEKLRQRQKHQPEDEKTYQAYVPVQQEWRIGRDGKRKKQDRIVLPALVFIHCTDAVRRKEIVRLPYIKRFMVNIAGAPRDNHRPVAVIPESQMRSLMRMVSDAESEVVIGSRPLHLGERVRVNGGKLVGLEGNVWEEPDGSTSLVVMIDILGCAKVTIASDLLSPM